MLGSLFFVQEAFAAPSAFFPNEHNGAYYIVVFVIVGGFIMWVSKSGDPPTKKRR